MYLGNQIKSIWSESSYSDSFMKSSLFKIEKGLSTYGTLKDFDYKDYFQISVNKGSYSLYVTGDSSNGFKASNYAYSFDVKIVDDSGNTLLTSKSYDLYTKSIDFSTQGSGTYYVEISKNGLAVIPYVATLKDTSAISLATSTKSSSTPNQKNEINGNAGFVNDSLIGSNGDDIIRGFSGDDTLKGGYGNDTLIGGFGADYLVGGAGKDVFKYESITDSGSTAYNDDIIVDFSQKDGDKIDLSALGKNLSLSFNDGYLSVNTQFIGATPMLIFLSGVTSLGYSDLVLA